MKTDITANQKFWTHKKLIKLDITGEAVQTIADKNRISTGFSEMLKISPEGSTSTLWCFGNWDPVLGATALHQMAQTACELTVLLSTYPDLHSPYDKEPLLITLASRSPFFLLFTAPNLLFAAFCKILNVTEEIWQISMSSQ